MRIGGVEINVNDRIRTGSGGRDETIEFYGQPFMPKMAGVGLVLENLSITLQTPSDAGRPIIEEQGEAAEVHHAEIQDAKLHYHDRTDEFHI